MENSKTAEKVEGKRRVSCSFRIFAAVHFDQEKKRKDLPGY